MLPANQAEAKILDLITPLDATHDIEVLPLVDASDRILAHDIVSALDFPHWDNSAMDGYAVRFMDTQTDGNRILLDIVEEIPAGHLPQQVIGAGQAARIFTGGMMPPGADTIVIQENTKREGDRVLIVDPPQQRYAFVRYKGAYHKAGQRLLQAGMRLQGADIAVLAAAQCATVNVFRKPRVAILSTGSELASIDQPLAPGQIVDSNQYALAALVRQAGAEPVCLGIVPDEPQQIKAAIAQALAQSDIVLSSGGVSVGDYDFVDRILTELGGTLHIRSVAVKPGKPLTVATIDPTGNESSGRSRLYFGLPGNPVSALVSFWRFVLPALRKLSGVSSQWRCAFINGRAAQDLKAGGRRETYLWGYARFLNGEYEFDLATGGHSSGNLINLAQTNSLAVVPMGQTHIAAGESVRLLLI
jgi:molybdopterin molybdotransferase